ncbi:MAG TPA: anthrone oxygenase family protein [Kineosporiaceae bacterium]|nr:anthrone oxygenase family protein [Kineosporiaceae bacterium]
MTTTVPSTLPVLTFESALTLGAALGCGLVAGVFFGFSSFVMRGLDRLPPGQAIAAMQSINVTVLRSAFLALLLLTALVCLPMMALAIWHRDERPATLVLIGGALYLLGVVALTSGYHVPLNDALAKVDPSGTDAAAQWHHYVVHWTRMNHLRTAAGLAAAAALVASLIRG